MNSKIICEKCNTEFSQEAKACFCYTSEINSVKSNDKKDSTNSIFAIIALILYLLIFYRLFFEPFNDFVNNYLPIMKNHFDMIFIVSAVFFPLIIAALIFTVVVIISRPKIIFGLIQLAFELSFKIIAFIFLLLLGLAVIVFAIKFIKNQLFN